MDKPIPSNLYIMGQHKIIVYYLYDTLRLVGPAIYGARWDPLGPILGPVYAGRSEVTGLKVGPFRGPNTLELLWNWPIKVK